MSKFEIEQAVCSGCENRGCCEFGVVLSCGLIEYGGCDLVLTPYDTQRVLEKLISESSDWRTLTSAEEIPF